LSRPAIVGVAVPQRALAGGVIRDRQRRE